MFDVLLCHIHLPVCLWIMDPHNRAPKKNISYGNDTTHLIQRHVTNGEVCAKIQQVIGPHEDLLITAKRCKLQWQVMSAVHQVWPTPSCKGQWKEEEDKADRGRGGKTTSGNGQAWSSASPRGQWRTGKLEKTGCRIICGEPTALVVKGLMRWERWEREYTLWEKWRATRVAVFTMCVHLTAERFLSYSAWAARKQSTVGWPTSSF